MTEEVQKACERMDLFNEMIDRIYSYFGAPIAPRNSLSRNMLENIIDNYQGKIAEKEEEI